MADRSTNRLRIKRTVERAVPMMDIDTTKVLTDEEIAELRRQMEARSDAVKLANEIGRAGLKDRLKKTMIRFSAEESPS